MAAVDAVERFVTSASGLGIEVAVRRCPEGTRTAVDAAAAVGCVVGQIVKSLVLMAGDRPVLVLCSGANRVDLVRVGAEFDGDVRMANADEVRAATGFAIGGAPPFGHPAPLPTLIDPDLLGYDEVWAAAGRPDSVFPLSPEALVEGSGARTVEVAL
ncbi:MAG: YbaK/EbsC family protein [Actinobacteria bacterium]|nr:YbaK/EbsC family protein [Actinomycetota bacterium]